MSKKGENIYKRKDGRYEARYVKERDINNKIVKYGYVYGRTYTEAKLKKNKALEQINEITKEDVIKVASKMKLRVSYFLGQNVWKLASFENF